MIKMQSRKAVRGVVVGVTLLGVTAVTPAFAEGGFDTYISGWTTGQESRTWTDANSDSTSTTVSFAGCRTDGSSGFQSANLKLWKSATGPDSSQGTKTNYCNTVSWGDKASGSYNFELTGFTTGGVLSVTTVKVRY